MSVTGVASAKRLLQNSRCDVGRQCLLLWPAACCRCHNTAIADVVALASTPLDIAIFNAISRFAVARSDGLSMRYTAATAAKPLCVTATVASSIVA